MKRFEPHCHSMYSNLRLLDCINRPKDIILTASKLGYSGVALTDHEALCGHVKWLKLEEELKKQDLIPKDFKCALGNEIYLTKDRTQAQKYYHFILIAKNTEGHRALRELSSNSWLHSYYYRGMERVPTLEKELEDMVHKYPNTLIASSACLGGRIPELVLQLVELEQKDDMDAITQKKIEIRDYLLWLKDLFGDDFYIEIAPGDSKDQIEYNKRIKRIASYYRIKQIIGTDAHYLTEDKRPIHKAFLNAKDGDREVDSFYKNAYLMSNEEIIEKIRLADYTVQDFEDMCNNSNEIYEKIESYNIFHSPIIPECQVENYPIEEDKRIEKYTHLFELKKSDNIQERCWVNDCLDALEKKGKWNDRYLTQLDSEADVLSFISHKLNNCMYSYFNTFKHYIDLFWECGSIVGPGRGCFVPGTKVTLSNGTTKNIEDVQIGDRVFTHKGRIRKVTNTMKYSINEELYTLSINGTDDITCTNNHKFWAIPNIKCKYKDNCVFSCKRNCKIKEKLKPRWVEARELKVDDMVAIPRFHYPEKAINYIDLKDYTQFINFHKVTDDSIYTFKGNNYINVRNVYKRYIHIDKDFLYFLGVFIGDGWVCNRDNYSKIGIAFNSETEKDQLSQKRIEEYLKKLDISYSIIHNQKGKKVNQLIFHNPFLGCFLKLNCGDGAENKHIPDSFLYNNREEMESLLCGLLNSDGSFAENRLSYDTINYNLANQVRNLFSYLGLYASIGTRAAHDNCKTSYKVRASGKQLELLSFLDFSGVRDVIQRDENYFYTRIKKITTQNYIGNVYDLSVEEDTSYIVNNVAVHNSSTGFLSNYLLGITQIDPIVYDLADFRFLNKERAELPERNWAV